jgi:aminoglycoside phosphotransferase (APT) family kinase protein
VRHDDITQERLQAYLQERFPEERGLRVTGFRMLIGGLQKLTILFDLEDRNGTQSLVLRGEQPDRFVMLDLGLIADEFDVVKLAFDAGLPVAEPLWVETDVSRLGRRFLVSRKVPGQNYGHATGVHTMPRSVARAFVATLAQMHRIPLASFAGQIRRTRIAHWCDFPDLATNTLANVDYWRNLPATRAHGASPALGTLYAWLKKNPPRDDAPPCLIHCDYGPHNVLIEGEKVSGILDW